MVAERFTPSPGDAPQGPDSSESLNKTGLRILGSMAPDSAISNTGVRMNLKSWTPDSWLVSEDNGSHNGRDKDLA